MQERKCSLISSAYPSLVPRLFVSTVNYDEATTYPCTEFSWYLVTCILFSYTKITANFSVLAGRPQCMVVFLMTQIRPRPH